LISRPWIKNSSGFVKVNKESIGLFMAPRDYYEVLGVGRNASGEEINQHFEGWRANIIRM
jgi:hypothetical protein